MANAASSTPASMRQVRDKCLNILLTGGATAPVTSAATPSAWTPGQSFGLNQHHWSSPVTPAPLESDVRLAELTAGLVAAGGMEARQSDTIKRLSEQLESSEKRIRTLEADVSRQKQSYSRGKDRVETKRSSTSVHRNNRSVGPTHGRTERENVRTSASKSEKRKGNSRVGTSANTEVLHELQTLRRKQVEWELARKRSELEAASLSQMMTDIKQNTKRLVEERDDQRKVIAHLENELASARRLSNPSNETYHQMSEPSAVSSEFRHSGEYVNQTRPLEDDRDTSPASVRQLNFESELEEGDFDDQQHEFETPIHHDHQRIERDLRDELRLVLLENEKLSERVPQLEAECFDLARKLRNAEKEKKQVSEQKALQGRQKEEINDTLQSTSSLSEPILDTVEELLEEIQVLEGISDAINFQMSPQEVEELQTTLTGLTMTEDQGDQDRSVRRTGPMPNVACQSEKAALELIVKKVARVRKCLSMRYGEWLRAVAAGDDSTTNVTLASRTGERDDSVSSINTDVIDRLISSSRTSS